jgi:hypothetical protein
VQKAKDAKPDVLFIFVPAAPRPLENLMSDFRQYLHLTVVAIPPTCRQERDFCRRRLARRKRLRDDISAQRPEIGDHLTREMAAKTAFVLAGLNI